MIVDKEAGRLESLINSDVGRSREIDVLRIVCLDRIVIDESQG